MRTILISAALGAASLFATPLFADTTDAENKALVQAGCLDGSDAAPGKLKIRTAIRCFQKSRGEETTGVLTANQQEALRTGRALSGTQQVVQSATSGNWVFVSRSAQYSDPKGGYKIGLKCNGAQLTMNSVISNMRAGNPVTLTIGTFSIEAVVDKGTFPSNSSVTASFPGSYNAPLALLTDAARSGADMTITWPTEVKKISTRGLAESLTRLRPLCSGEIEAERLAKREREKTLYDRVVENKPTGLPSLTTEASGANDSDRKKAWDAFGFEFRAEDVSVFVASIRTDSPAYLRGLRVGDIVEADSINGFKGGGVERLHGTMARLAEYANDGIETRAWTLILTRIPGISGLKITIPAPNAAPTEDDILAQNARPLPAIWRDFDDDLTLLSLWRHQLTSIETRDQGIFVMRALYALSLHVNECHGPNPVDIPFQIIMTEVERNGFGRETDREVTEFDKSLTVRREFEGLARQNLRFFSDNAESDWFLAVRDLITQEGCDGRNLRWLEAGLAKAGGVSLETN